jgi:exosortase/archaeosortase family protein
VPALSAGTTVRLAQTWVGVDENCGGMRSLQAGVMAGLFFGEWLRLAWPRRLGLVAIGILAAVLGNLLRILLLVWRASVGGDAALHAAHDVAGWLALATSLGVTGVVAAALRPPARAALPLPKAIFVRTPLPRPMLRWAATVAVLLTVIELGTRGWYLLGAARRAANVPQWTARFPADAAGFHVVPLAEDTRELLRPDHFSAAEWRDQEQHLAGAYYVEWQRGQAARSLPFLHNPTVCLPLSGWVLVRAAGTQSVRWSGGEIPFHAYVFRRTGEEFVVGFAIWDPSRGRPLASTAAGWNAWMAAQFSDVIEARADQPAQLLSLALWCAGAEERLGSTLATLIFPRH